jgi:hypothetical protein
MKIEKNHYEILKTAMKKTLLEKTPCKTGKELIDYYEKHNIGKNKIIRASWDILNNSMINDKNSCFFISEVLYKYLNDEHINTALKKIISEI